MLYGLSDHTECASQELLPIYRLQPSDYVAGSAQNLSPSLLLPLKLSADHSRFDDLDSALAVSRKILQRYLDASITIAALTA
jgi:hypothetical protein